jgi:hypothetical protein
MDPHFCEKDVVIGFIQPDIVKSVDLWAPFVFYHYFCFHFPLIERFAAVLGNSEHCVMELKSGVGHLFITNAFEQTDIVAKVPSTW